MSSRKRPTRPPTPSVSQRYLSPSEEKLGPLEKKIEKKVDKYIKRHLGGKTRKMNGMGFRDWPDRMVLLPGCPVLFIEFKRRGRDATPSQADLHKELRAMGYEVWVEDDAEFCIRKVNAWYVMQQSRGHPAVNAAIERGTIYQVPKRDIPRRGARRFAHREA